MFHSLLTLLVSILASVGLSLPTKTPVVIVASSTSFEAPVISTRTVPVLKLVQISSGGTTTRESGSKPPSCTVLVKGGLSIGLNDGENGSGKGEVSGVTTIQWEAQGADYVENVTGERFAPQVAMDIGWSNYEYFTGERASIGAMPIRLVAHGPGGSTSCETLIQFGGVVID